MRQDFKKYLLGKIKKSKRAISAEQQLHEALAATQSAE